MQNALESLMAVIPVDVSNLKIAINEYETTHGIVRDQFFGTDFTAEQFANDVVCFLTACDLYMDTEYQDVHALWLNKVSHLMSNNKIKSFYHYLLHDALVLAVSKHYIDRVQKLIDETK